MQQTFSTLEFFCETKRRLSAKGIFVANLISTDRLYLKRTLNKIGSVFPELWLLPGDVSNNTITFATHAKLSQAEIVRHAQLLQKDLPYHFHLTRLTANLSAAS